MAFNEDTRVKIPALAHLSKLGYVFREVGQLKLNPENNVNQEECLAVLRRLNPSNSELEISIHLKKALSSLDNDDLGREFYELLVNQSGIRLVDFEHPESNTWECVTELEYRNGLEVFRPDITLFLNGIPICFVEVKKPNNREGILAERNRIDHRMRNPKFKRFVNLTQLMVFSNNMPYEEDLEPLQGAFYGTTSKSKVIFNYFREEDSTIFKVAELEKLHLVEILRITNTLGLEKDPAFQTNLLPTSPTNKILTSLFSRERILFLLRFGIAYIERSGGQEKHVMRYPQLFASLSVQKSLSAGVKKGIIWHTQGSGKTALAFYLNGVIRDYYREEVSVPKFYFIVDRLDLLVQARNEFQMRGLTVNTIQSREQLSQDFDQVRAVKNPSGKPEITLVNIQKFQDQPVDSTLLNSSLNRQRVYFVDEAHRSYKTDGMFLRSLISSDPTAIILSLTGTPLIGKNSSTDVFGPYIHKYFYDSSIADGYTLRLIREGVEAHYRMQLNSALSDLEIAQGSAKREILFSHPSYVKPMVEYILYDFVSSRKMHGDSSIGAMIICDSSDQAREIYRTMSEDKGMSSKGIRSALILHDHGTKEEREVNVREFKAGSIDILIVFNMLLTGFDAGRLKKLYLGRVVREHNLLQALTRVNRPYNDFKYGYVVDFADIREEFEETSRAYFEELKSELGANFEAYSKLFLSADEVSIAVETFRRATFGLDLKNLEKFSNQISIIERKSEIQEILRSFEMLAQTFRAAVGGQSSSVDTPNPKDLKQMITELKNRYAFLTLRSNLLEDEVAGNLLNYALEDIYFDFTKVGESELEVTYEARNKLKQARESLHTNFDKEDREYLKLYAELRRFFELSNLHDSDSAAIGEAVKILERVISLSDKLNRENERIKVAYSGDSKFARVHKRVREMLPSVGENLVLSRALVAVRNDVELEIDRNHQIVENEGYFSRMVNRSVFTAFQKNLDFEDLESLEAITQLICDEYHFRRLEDVA